MIGMAGQVRITPAVHRVLTLILDDLTEPLYGYRIMDETGFPSGKVYQILDRLTAAGWLIRHDAGSDAPRRITYTLPSESVPAVRRALSEAGERATQGRRQRVHVPKGLQTEAASKRQGVLRWVTG